MRKSSRPLDFFLILLFTAFYFVIGKLGLSLAFVNESATAVWPPTGVSLAVLLLLGNRMWLGVLIGAFLVNWTTTGMVETSVGIAAGNTLEAVTGAFFIQRFAGGRQALNLTSNVFKFVFFEILATALSATIGVIDLVLGGLAASAATSSVWLTWWLGDLVSAVIIAPFLLIWSGPLNFHIKIKTVLEVLLLIALVFITGQVIFGGWFPSQVQSYPLEYLGIPLLLWGVFRFGQRGATGVVFLMSAIAIRGTLLGFGPFSTQDPNTSFLLLQAFMTTFSLIGLVMASILLEQKRAQEERASFVSTVSHELRTPLTAIKDSIDIVCDEISGPINLDQKKFLLMAKKNVERLARLIHKVLDFQKLHAKDIAFEFEDQDINELLEEAVETVRSLAAQKGLGFSVQSASSLPHVKVDRDRILEVLINLLDNAIKFTERGNIALTVQEADKGIRISVVDMGVGIRREDMPKLFKPFSQIRTEAGSGTGGTGLGLTISKKIVEQHGGKLWVESEFGRGSKFILFLPV